MIRLFNIIISLILLAFFAIPAVLIFILVKTTSKGPAIFWSQRIGINNTLFPMPKFRTMLIETPQVATHLLTNSGLYTTPIGTILRKTSIDEIPQIWCVLNGTMNLVGPRPALFNQLDLIELRTKHNVHLIAPGITGWAQVNGRDELSISKKVELDTYYLQHRSIWLDLKILFLTFYRVILRKNITH